MKEQIAKYWDTGLEILFYIVLTGLLLYGNIWATYGVSGVLYIVLFYGFVLLGWGKVVLQKNTMKEWALIGVLGVLSVISWRVSQDKTPVLLALGILGSKNLKLDRLVKISLISNIFISGVLIAVPLLGIEPMYMTQQGDRIRYFFNWNCPGAMGLTALVICMEWMYLRHLKFRWFDYAGICTVWMFEHFTGNARTTDVIMVVLLASEFFSTLLARKKPEWEQYRLWALGCCVALLASLVLPVIGVKMYLANPVDMSVSTSNFLSRFLQPGRFFEAHGMTLFGTPYDPNVYDYLDMYFGYVTLHLGIVMAVIVLILMIRTIIWAYKNKKEKLLMFFMFVLLRSTIESEHFTLVYAFFPVLLGMSLWEQKNEQQ